MYKVEGVCTRGRTDLPLLTAQGSAWSMELIVITLQARLNPAYHLSAS